MKHKLLLLLLVVTSIKLEAQIFNDGIFEYTVIDATNNYVSIGKYNNNCPEGDVVIPETIENLGTIYSVTSISEKGFFSCNNIKTIVLPETIVSIKQSAFINCIDLQSINLVGSINTIEEKAFYNCESLTDIIFPENLIEIGAYAFAKCSSLANVLFSANITTIGAYAFFYCESLIDVTIPGQVTEIKEGTFSFCLGLKTVSLSENLKSLGSSAFRNCTSLMEITVPEGTTHIERFCFLKCKNLKSVTILEGVTSIGEGAFMSCENLNDISLPSTVTSIGENAFGACWNLHKLTLNWDVPLDDVPSNLFFYVPEPILVVPLGTKGTYQSSSMWNYEVIKETGNFFNDGVLEYTIIDSEKNYVSVSKNSGICPEELTIPETVNYNNETYTITTIEKRGFSRCRNLKKVIIPESVTTIREAAFNNCNNLTDINIPKYVSNIENRAFSGCKSLQDITIPQYVTSIKTSVFSGCENLQGITIPEHVTSIENNAFYGCNSLTDVKVKRDDPLEISTYAFNNQTATLTVPLGTKEKYASSQVWQDFQLIREEGSFFSDGVLEYTITDSVNNFVSVGKYNGNCPEELTIPETVNYNGISYTIKAIGNAAFKNCSSIKKVIIPESITSIDQYAFFNCTGLRNINLPTSITSLGYGVFGRCANLVGVTVNWATPLQVQNNLFFGSNGISTLFVPIGTKETYATTEVWQDFQDIREAGSYFNDGQLEYIITDFENNLVSVGKYNGYCPTGELLIPETITHNETVYTVTKIMDYGFINCESITSVEIPETITSIGIKAFNYCMGLTIINIPKSVTHIGDKAFDYCGNLYKVEVNWTTPVHASYYTFYNYSNYMTLIVPKTTKEAYENSVYTVWTNFKEIIEVGSYFNDGKLQYTILDSDNNYVSVAKNSNTCPEEEDLIIPSTVVFEDNTYTVTEIREKAFIYCDKLKSVDIPNTVTHIGGSAFYGCSNLRKVHLSNNLASIEDFSFYGCSSLEDVEIPNTVGFIGIHSFNNCENLSNVFVDIVTPLNIDPSVFEDVSLENVLLHVPEGKIMAYQSAKVWQDFYIQEDTNVLSLENFTRNNVKIYPNPVRDMLYISLNNSTELESIKLYNLQGQLLKQGFEKMFNLSPFSSGIYVLEIETTKGTSTKKIVIE